MHTWGGFASRRSASAGIYFWHAIVAFKVLYLASPIATDTVGLQGTWACQPDSAAEILRDPQANLEEPLRGLHVLRPVPDLLIANYVRFSQTGDLVLYAGKSHDSLARSVCPWYKPKLDPTDCWLGGEARLNGAPSPAVSLSRAEIDAHLGSLLSR
jgi:hypothetical protein